jgi:hypothetical protein
MTIISDIETAIIFAAIGSLLGELLLIQEWLRYPQKRKVKSLGEFLRRGGIAIINMVFAVVFIIAYSLTLKELNPFLAIHIGASAPLLCRVLA